MRHLTLQTLLGLGALLAVGCTAILGDFDVSPQGTGEDAINDGDGGDALAAPIYHLAGTVKGLRGSGLVLSNAGAVLPIAAPMLGDSGVPSDAGVGAEARFVFPDKFAPGAPYAVDVLTQPIKPLQHCKVAGGAGNFSKDVDDVTVTCTTAAFKLVGTLTMPAGGRVVLQNNLGDDLVMTAAGGFAFATPVPNGQPYAVTVHDAPGQTCTVTKGSGIVGPADVTDIAVSCTPNGKVIDVFGASSPAFFVPCGDGSNTNCTKAVAESSCTSIGKKLVSHASDGTSSVVSLGATTSCQYSISYFTAFDPALGAAGQCLIGISNADWTSCCTTANWHGNIVPFPATVAQQFGFVASSNSGYNASLVNTTGLTWGCFPTTTSPPARAGCASYNVACK